MSSRHSAAALIAGVVVVFSSIIQADIIYVDDDNCPGPGSGTGEDPFCSIQDAIDAAVDGDEIIVAPGTYFEAVNFVGKAITLRSSDGPEVTIIDATGQGQVSVVICETLEGPDTVLEGFTITGGTGTDRGGFDWGGGMFNVSSHPTVTDCWFSGNSADNGGGMANLGSPPTWPTACSVGIQQSSVVAEFSTGQATLR